MKVLRRDDEEDGLPRKVDSAHHDMCENRVLFGIYQWQTKRKIFSDKGLLSR